MVMMCVYVHIRWASNHILNLVLIFLPHSTITYIQTNLHINSSSFYRENIARSGHIICDDDDFHSKRKVFIIIINLMRKCQLEWVLLCLPSMGG